MCVVATHMYVCTREYTYVSVWWLHNSDELDVFDVYAHIYTHTYTHTNTRTNTYTHTR